MSTITCADFREAKKYLESIGKWKEAYNFRLDGYEIVAIADLHKKKNRKRVFIVDVGKLPKKKTDEYKRLLSFKLDQNEEVKK